MQTRPLSPTSGSYAYLGYSATNISMTREEQVAERLSTALASKRHVILLFQWPVGHVVSVSPWGARGEQLELLNPPATQDGVLLYVVYRVEILLRR